MGSVSQWKPVMTGVHQGSIRGPIFVNMFLNKIDSGTEQTLNKFVNYTKLTLEESGSIQIGIGRFENAPMQNSGTSTRPRLEEKWFRSALQRRNKK